MVAAVFRDGEVLWRGRAWARRTSGGTRRRRRRTRTASARSRRRSRRSASSSSGTPESSSPRRPAARPRPRGAVGPTVANALSHLSGLQREPAGDIWESLEPPTREELLAGLEDAERVLEPGRAWHYSNLAFGLLGEVVARHGGGGLRAGAARERARAARARRDRLRPTWRRGRPGTTSTRTATRVTVEPDLPVEGPTAAMGWLWSTVDDLARWGDFLATGRDDVLARATLDEMARVRTMVDHVSWEVGWGLGLGLYRRGDRVYAGHGGAMPGSSRCCSSTGRERTGAAVLANTSAGFAPDALALDLAEAALETLVRDARAVAARRRRTGRRRAAPRPLVVGGLRARRALEGRPPRDRAAVRPAGAERLVAHAGGRRPLAGRRGPRARRAAPGRPRRGGRAGPALPRDATR